MKAAIIAVIFGVMEMGVVAQTIILEGIDGSTLTTGDLIDEADEIGLTTNVVEIPDLQITARSGAANQDVNSLTQSLGIDSDGGVDDSDAFEDGEQMFLSFNKDLAITQFDFNGVESGEVFRIEVDGAVLDIAYDDLANKSTDIFNTNLLVTAGQDIGFSVANTNSIIGLDGLTVNVIAGADVPGLNILSSNGMIYVSALFDGAAVTNHVLQCSTNLATNVWTTISGPFTSDTNWIVEATNSAGFYRVIPN
jgi:hypothetical protein